MTTCYSNCSTNNVSCKNTSCKQWCSFSENYNCMILAVNNGPHTLHDIGKAIGNNRISTGQQEKEIINKICKFITS